MTKEEYELKLKLAQHNNKSNSEGLLHAHSSLMEEYIKSLEEQIIPRKTLINLLYQSCYNAGVRGESTMFEKDVTRVMLNYVSFDELLDELRDTFKNSKPILDIVEYGIEIIKNSIFNA